MKWQLEHQTEPERCPLTLHSWSIYPSIYNDNNNACVRCFTDHWHDRVPIWRTLQEPDLNVEKWNSKASGIGYSIWTNPWRSQWAPPVANEFICSDCWDLEFRPRPHPAQEEVGKRHLRCLCARRQDLGTLLVCRKWYEEAGAIFYARNTFAFESAAVLTGFVTSLPPRWKPKVSRVSIMAYHPDDKQGPVEEASGWEGNHKLSRVWPLLHQLPRLSYLELDAHFLSRAKTASRLLKLSLQNVRRVCFVMHNPLRTNYAIGSPFIWPEYHNARLIVGGFAEEVARAIKGQKPRRGLRRTQQASILAAAAREEGSESQIMGLNVKDYHLGMESGNTYHSTSATAYARLWWAEQKANTNGSGGAAAHFSRLNGLHAYIGTEYTHLNGIQERWNTEQHWRHWKPTSLRNSDFGLRNPAVWREAAGWEVLFPIQAEEFLDESAREWRGWEALSGIEV